MHSLRLHVYWINCEAWFVLQRWVCRYGGLEIKRKLRVSVIIALLISLSRSNGVMVTSSRGVLRQAVMPFGWNLCASTPDSICSTFPFLFLIALLHLKSAIYTCLLKNLIGCRANRVSTVGLCAWHSKSVLLYWKVLWKSDILFFISHSVKVILYLSLWWTFVDHIH